MKHADKDFWLSSVLCHLMKGIFAMLLIAVSAQVMALPATQVKSAQMILTVNGSFDTPALTATMPPGTPRAVDLPHVFPRGVATAANEKADDVLTAWYEIAIPPAAQLEPSQPLRLYVPRWQTVGQIAVYADGRLIFRSGAGPVWNGFNHPLWVALSGVNNGKPSTPLPQTVLIRIDHLRSAGLALSSVWLGNQAELSQKRWWRDFMQTDLTATLSAAFLLIGVFALGAWVLRREAMYGLFFLVSLFNFMRNLHYHLGLEPLPIPEAWFGWMTINSIFWVLVTAHIFGFRLYAVNSPKIEKVMIGVTLVASVISLPGLTSFPTSLPYIALLTPPVYLTGMVMIVLMTLISIRAAWRSRSQEARLVIAWNLLVMPSAFHDAMLQNYQINIEQVYLLPYTMLGFFPIFLYVVLKRYEGALRQVERANADLQTSLRAKELELGDSYARLRLIENEQVLSTERQRLMQDMHDGLGSSLMGALKAVESGRELDLGEVLRECIDDLKLAIDSLEPIQSDLLLLLATLRYRLGTRLEQAGVQLRWNVQDIPAIDWLDPHSALHILRILQEIFSNAVKHSNAVSITLTTAVQGDHVVVAIEDNGVGFDVSHQHVEASQGKGLTNVKRRAQAIGAQVSWHALPVGTRFELRLPLTAPPLQPTRPSRL